MIIGLWYQQKKLFLNVLDGNRRGAFISYVIFFKFFKGFEKAIFS